MDKKSSLQLYGLIGYPVEHSLSAAMHNEAFSHLKIDAEYKLFEVKPEELENFLLKDVFSRNIAGFNITIPHKVKAKEILEKEFPFNKDAILIQEDLYYAKLSGAINTVRRDGSILKYWNTDAPGFLESLEKDLKFKTKDKNVLIIGCGGAGRAIIAALSWKQVEIKKIYINDTNEEIINSTKEHFLQFPHLKDKIEFISTQDIPRFIKVCDLLVNASPVGMKDKDTSIIDKNLFHKELYVYDIVYNQKGKTCLVKDAESLQLKVADGLSMLLYQGKRAFELWTGMTAPLEIMRRALMEATK